ncbi:MAG: hypothetical protein RMK29_22105 [Myxococcales bacterium]|nr:hypothetical protein [Myxococcales bacterium]
MLPRRTNGRLSEPEDAARLLMRLRDRSRLEGPLRLVRADAAVLAGLPPERAEAALRRLLGEYRSHLMVTEEGELVYEFAPGLVRRDARTAKEWLVRAGQATLSALWQAFQVGFKVWIAATLVAYTVIFALVGLLMMLVSDNDGAGELFLWWLLPDWRFTPCRLRGAPRKRFYRSVFDYVFGPARVVPGEQEQDLLAFIRASKGRITATDLVLLRGWSYVRAEEEATRLLARYDGEPEVSADGVLIYSFRELRRTAQAQQDRSASPAAHGALMPYLPEPPLTGNRTATNVGITLLNGFNLVAALTLGPLAATTFGLGTLGTALLTVVPLVFSVIFFAVPLARLIGRQAARRRRRRHNLRRALLASIAARRGAPASAAELIGQAVTAVIDEALRQQGQLEDRAALRRLAADELERLMRDLDGDVKIPEGMEGVRYEFPRLREELAAVEQARQAAPDSERQLGPIIFSSAAEADEV